MSNSASTRSLDASEACRLVSDQEARYKSLVSEQKDFFELVLLIVVSCEGFSRDEFDRFVEANICLDTFYASAAKFGYDGEAITCLKSQRCEADYVDMLLLDSGDLLDSFGALDDYDDGFYPGSASDDFADYEEGRDELRSGHPEIAKVETLTIHDYMSEVLYFAPKGRARRYFV